MTEKQAFEFRNKCLKRYEEEDKRSTAAITLNYLALVEVAEAKFRNPYGDCLTLFA